MSKHYSPLQRRNTSSSLQVAAHFKEYYHDENLWCVFNLLAFISRKSNEENQLHEARQLVLTEDQKDECKKDLTKYILFLLVFLSVPILPQTTQSRTPRWSYSAADADAGTRGRREHSCLPTLVRWSRSNCCQTIWSQINIHKSVLHYVKLLSCTANSEYRLSGFCAWLIFMCGNSLEEYFWMPILEWTPPATLCGTGLTCSFCRVFLVIPISV